MVVGVIRFLFFGLGSVVFDFLSFWSGVFETAFTVAPFDLSPLFERVFEYFRFELFSFFDFVGFAFVTSFIGVLNTNSHYTEDTQTLPDLGNVPNE